MPTTGKTSAASPTYSTTILETYAKTGKLEPLLATTIRGVPCKHTAPDHMAGRNRFITHYYIRHCHASREAARKTWHVATTTKVWVIWEWLSSNITSLMPHRCGLDPLVLVTMLSFHQMFKRLCLIILITSRNFYTRTNGVRRMRQTWPTNCK